MTGNGLAVFLDTADWPASVMQRITREMRQFESIFLSECSPLGAAARVFTVDEELPFAGHPVLGAAAVLHRTQAPNSRVCAWTLRLPYGAVPVTTCQQDDHYLCEMNQGPPIIGTIVSAPLLGPILKQTGSALITDTVGESQPKVISTGACRTSHPRLAIGLVARSRGTDLSSCWAPLAQSLSCFLTSMHGRARTWDNLGHVEDVATGSAAGPAAAYLLRHGRAEAASPIVLSQGRFAGRPSKILVVADKVGDLLVSGQVWPVCHGTVDLNLAAASGVCDP
jgi:predicted PhzF superfamily epimerase YddE/YHI9